MDSSDDIFGVAWALVMLTVFFGVWMSEIGFVVGYLSIRVPRMVSEASFFVLDVHRYGSAQDCIVLDSILLVIFGFIVGSCIHLYNDLHIRIPAFDDTNLELTSYSNSTENDHYVTQHLQTSLRHLSIESQQATTDGISESTDFDATEDYLPTNTDGKALSGDDLMELRKQLMSTQILANELQRNLNSTKEDNVGLNIAVNDLKAAANTQLRHHYQESSETTQKLNTLTHDHENMKIEMSETQEALKASKKDAEATKNAYKSITGEIEKLEGSSASLLLDTETALMELASSLAKGPIAFKLMDTAQDRALMKKLAVQSKATAGRSPTLSQNPQMGGKTELEAVNTGVDVLLEAGHSKLDPLVLSVKEGVRAILAKMESDCDRRINGMRTEVQAERQSINSKSQRIADFKRLELEVARLKTTLEEEQVAKKVLCDKLARRSKNYLPRMVLCKNL